MPSSCKRLHRALVAEFEMAHINLGILDRGSDGFGDLTSCFQFRTASVTSAPALASTRAVSMPMPEEAPVTIARRPRKSTPAITSSAAEPNRKGVVISAIGFMKVYYATSRAAH